MSMSAVKLINTLTTSSIFYIFANNTFPLLIHFHIWKIKIKRDKSKIERKSKFKIIRIYESTSVKSVFDEFNRITLFLFPLLLEMVLMVDGDIALCRLNSSFLRTIFLKKQFIFNFWDHLKKN